jgi:hypothetical protein
VRFTFGKAIFELACRRVNQFLASGGGLHQICMEVPDFQVHIEASQAACCTLVRVPMPAVAFGGQKIAWITTRNGQLMELLEI